jgi:hypothetical protein
MKLFLIIYIAGKIGGVAGPLPYDMAECQRRAASMWSELRPGVRTPMGYTRDDVKFSCEMHDTRPKINF